MSRLELFLKQEKKNLPACAWFSTLCCSIFPCVRLNECSLVSAWSKPWLTPLLHLSLVGQGLGSSRGIRGVHRSKSPCMDDEPRRDRMAIVTHTQYWIWSCSVYSLCNYTFFHLVFNYIVFFLVTPIPRCNGLKRLESCLGIDKWCTVPCLTNRIL